MPRMLPYKKSVFFTKHEEPQNLLTLIYNSYPIYFQKENMSVKGNAHPGIIVSNTK